MIPLERVQQIVNTYETLEKELSSSILTKKILLRNLKNTLVLVRLLMKLKVT